MRKLTVLLYAVALTGFLIFNLSPAWAEEPVALRTGYVDLELVLENYPAYVEAREELEELNVKFREEMEEKRSEIDEMRGKLEQSDMLGPRQQEQMRQELMQKMQQFQIEAQSGQERLEEKQEELLGPVREVVQQAVREVAADRELDIVHRYDLENATVLWVSEKMEISEQVMERLEEREDSAE
ncbi:MAG: OmpH family outer membrane protein [bacterium]